MDVVKNTCAGNENPTEEQCNTLLGAERETLVAAGSAEKERHISKVGNILHHPSTTMPYLLSSKETVGLLVFLLESLQLFSDESDVAQDMLEALVFSGEEVPL